MTILNQAASHPRRVVLLGALATLAGCAARPVLLDRASMSGVKQVALPTVGFPAGPTVDVTNGAGKRLGAIGLLTDAVVMNNRADALSKLMAARGFDPQACFTQRLTGRLQARGLQVAPQAADRARQAFLEAYGVDAGDAILDVFVSRYGYVAYSDADDQPYRPMVAIGMRLIGRDRSILMRDRLALDGVDTPLERPGGAPAPVSFQTFTALKQQPALAVAGLQGAFAYAADAVGKRLA